MGRHCGLRIPPVAGSPLLDNLWSPQYVPWRPGPKDFSVLPTFVRFAGWSGDGPGMDRAGHRDHGRHVRGPESDAEGGGGRARNVAAQAQAMACCAGH